MKTPATKPRIRRAQGMIGLVWFACLICSIGATAQTLPTRLGDLDADAQPTVLDLVRLINHVNAADPLPASLLPYGDLDEDGVIGQVDVDFLAAAILGAVPLPNPFAAPVVSAPVTATNGSSLTLTGVSRPNRTILVEGGAENVEVIADGAGLFTVNVPLKPNRLNTLFLTASNGTFTAGIPPTTTTQEKNA